MLSYLVTDMYLPAFEFIRIDMSTSESAVGMSLTVFLAGMAIGQLIYGPLSNRYGRKPVLLIGLAILACSTVVIALSSSIEVFLIARFIQAIGACSASVIWQAVVIDRYQGRESQKLFAMIMPLVALSPALAPLLGAVLQSHFGWRAIFAAIIVITLLIILMTLREKESYQTTKKIATAKRSILADYKSIITSKKFTGNMLLSAAASATFFAWLTGSPFVMNSMGYSHNEIGLWYIPQTIAFIVGGYTCKSLLEKYKDSQILPVFILLSVVSILLISIYAYLVAATTIVPYVVAFCFIAIGNGAIYPLVINRALEDFKQCSATASGLFNFLQTVFCFAASAFVSAFAEYGIHAIAAAMSAMLVIFFAGSNMIMPVISFRRRTA